MAPAAGEEPMKRARFTEEQMSRSCARPTRRRPSKSQESTRSASRQSTTGAVTSAPLRPPTSNGCAALEGENAKLKRILAERDLEIDTLKEINRQKW